MDDGIAKKAYQFILIIEEHFHGDQLAAPWGALPVLLISGAGAYNWGVYSADIIAAGITPMPFDLHWAIFSDPDTNANYEIEFVYGPGDTVAGQCQFTRAAPFATSISIPVKTAILPAGSRVRARMRDSVGSSEALASVLYHDYHNPIPY